MYELVDLLRWSIFGFDYLDDQSLNLLIFLNNWLLGLMIFLEDRSLDLLIFLNDWSLNLLIFLDDRHLSLIIFNWIINFWFVDWFASTLACWLFLGWLLACWLFGSTSGLLFSLNWPLTYWLTLIGLWLVGQLGSWMVIDLDQPLLVYRLVSFFLSFGDWIFNL